MVDSRPIDRSSRVESESVMCLPAKTRRRSDDGRLVRRARRDFSVDIEVLEGTVIGIAAKGQLGRLESQISETTYYGRQRP
jgi:hypothetical protein